MVKEFPESVKFVALLRRLNLAENIEGHLQYFSNGSTVRYQGYIRQFSRYLHSVVNMYLLYLDCIRTSVLCKISDYSEFSPKDLVELLKDCFGPFWQQNIFARSLSFTDVVA